MAALVGRTAAVCLKLHALLRRLLGGLVVGTLALGFDKVPASFAHVAMEPQPGPKRPPATDPRCRCHIHHMTRRVGGAAYS